MKRILLCVVFVAAMVVWCMPSFAADPLRETHAGPGGTFTLTTGITNGVDLTAQGTGSTLNIGAGDSVFTYNNPLGTAIDPIAIKTDTSSQSHIVFLGASTVYGDIGSAGGIFLDIKGGAAATTVNFLGDVHATQVIFTADSTITLAANKTVTNGAVTTTGPANSGTLVLNDGSNWGGTSTAAVTGIKAVNILGGSNTAGVTAIITGAVGAQQFSLLTNRLNMTGGALTISSGGIINTTLASSSVYGHITVSGATTITDTVLLNVTVPSGSYIPLGTLFDIVNSTGVITSSIIPTITPVGGSNPLYTFAVEPITGTAAGKLTIKTTGTPIQPANPVANPIANVVGVAIATLPSTSPIVVAINALTTAAGVANAEAQLAPSTTSLAAPLVTYQGIQEFQNLWLAHLDACGQVSWPSEDKENCKGKDAVSGWWLKGFGYWGSQNARGAFTAYDSRIVGTMLAYDRPLGLNTRGGLGFGYSQSINDGKN